MGAARFDRACSHERGDAADLIALLLPAAREPFDSTVARTTECRCRTGTTTMQIASMNPITITLHVDAGTAARLGQSVAGPATVKLTSDDLGRLTPRQRATLARHLDKVEDPTMPDDSPRWGDPLAMHADPIGAPSFDALVRLLDTREAIMVALERRVTDERARAAAQAALDRATIEAAIGRADASWLPVWRDGFMPAHVLADMLGKNAFWELDTVAAPYVPQHDAAESAASFLSPREHAILAALTDMLARSGIVGATIEPRREHSVESDACVGTFAVISARIAGVEVERRYCLGLAPTSVDDLIELQRSITAAVLDVPLLIAGAAAEHLRRAIANGGELRGRAALDVEAMAGAVRDPVTWAALANARTVAVAALRPASEVAG